ncbi:uncharacterized protein LOC128232453 isoform X2 [Mya arenaria]|uniref:uncharacterized protein LOC128232453 isoform X2 n=1 Tax=Mya arenaria TaxID=6604 RepID=UPI0022E476FB|nr:uncharacterized protein LOC128232453 isoform X2 [Mya arenaria]
MSELGFGPGDYEHVTKMGRVGPRFGDNKPRTSVGPQFRRLPFQTTETLAGPRTLTPVSAPHSADADSVIIRSSSPISDHLSVDRHRQRQPYIEMKLGRNMRATPKGSIPIKHVNTQLEGDASEPLLVNQPHSTNPVVDYFTNTHPGHRPIYARPYGLSGSPALRSINSPQHPSQDLIETLNRNQRVKSSRDLRSPERQEDTERKQVVKEDDDDVEERRRASLAQELARAQQRQDRLEAEARRLREADSGLTSQSGNQRDSSDIMQEVEAQGTQDSKQSHKDAVIITTKAEINTPPANALMSPPPHDVLYPSYKSQAPQVEAKSDFGSSQPFTPLDSGAFKSTGDTSTSATVSTGIEAKVEEAESRVSVEKLSLQQQETVEEIEEIEEEVEGGGQESSDGEFNF